MSKLTRTNGWSMGAQWRKDLQAELDKYIQRATKRGYTFMTIKKWHTSTHRHVRWDRVRLLDIETGRIRNMFYNDGWHLTTAAAKEKFQKTLGQFLEERVAKESSELTTGS